MFTRWVSVVPWCPVHAVLRFGGSETQGQVITLTQSDKWLRQAGVLDTWTITTIDTALAFRLLPSINVLFSWHECGVCCAGGCPAAPSTWGSAAGGSSWRSSCPGRGSSWSASRSSWSSAAPPATPTPPRYSSAAPPPATPTSAGGWPPGEGVSRISQYSSFPFSLLEVLLLRYYAKFIDTFTTRLAAGL